MIERLDRVEEELECQQVFVVDRFYIALFSAREHSFRSRVILHE